MMDDTLLTVLQTVMPVLSIVLLGYVLGRKSSIDPTTLSELALWVTAPCFIFTSLAQNKTSMSEVLVLAGGALWTALAVAGIAWWATRNNPNRRGFVMCAALWNAGNLPVPCLELLLGEEGRQAAVIIFVTIGLLHSTAGIAFTKGRGGFREVFKLPLIYACVLGAAVAAAEVQVPAMIGVPVEWLGNMAIPLMLLALGIQLRNLSIRDVRGSVAVASLRILGGLAAMGSFVWIWDVSGIPRTALLLNAIMPSAVINHVITRRYGASPELAASAIVLTTLLSLVTVPLMLLYLAD